MDTNQNYSHDKAKRARTSSYNSNNISMKSVNVFVNLTNPLSPLSRVSSLSSDFLLKEQKPRYIYFPKTHSCSDLPDTCNESTEKESCPVIEYRIRNDPIDMEAKILENDAQIQTTIRFNDESQASSIETTVTYLSTDTSSIVYSTSRLNVFSDSFKSLSTQSTTKSFPEIDLTLRTTMQISNTKKEDDLNISPSSLNSDIDHKPSSSAKPVLSPIIRNIRPTKNFSSQQVCSISTMNIGSIKPNLFNSNSAVKEPIVHAQNENPQISSSAPSEMVISEVVICTPPSPQMPYHVPISSYNLLPPLPSRLPLPNQNIRTFTRPQYSYTIPCQINSQQFLSPTNFHCNSLESSRPRSSFQSSQPSDQNSLARIRSASNQPPGSLNIVSNSTTFLNSRPIQLPMPTSQNLSLLHHVLTPTLNSSPSSHQPIHQSQAQNILMPTSLNPWTNHLQMIGINSPVIRTTQLVTHSNLHAQVFQANRSTTPFPPQSQPESATITNIETVNLIFDYTSTDKGLTKEELDKLPTRCYQIVEDQIINMEEDENGYSLRRCMICLEDFIIDESVLRALACKHEFHIQCVDQWLDKKRTCPLCRAEASIS